MVATGKSPRLGLSTEFTRWKQRLDPKNAASTGMKPVESHGPSLRLVATNYRPTGIKPTIKRGRLSTAASVQRRNHGAVEQMMRTSERVRDRSILLDTQGVKQGAAYIGWRP